MTRWRFIIGAAIVVATTGVWLSQRADAIIIANRTTIDTGIFGVAAGTTARVHVLNASGFAADGPPCVVEVRFFDATATVLGRQQLKIMPGHAQFVDFSDASLRGAERKHVRAIVAQMLTGDFDQPTPVCIATTEVFDNRTGQAGIIIINSHPVQ